VYKRRVLMGIVLTISVKANTEFPICLVQKDQMSPAVVWNGTNYLVAWEDCRNNEYDVYGQIINADGSFVGEIPISTKGGDQMCPAVTGGNGKFLVVWIDDRNILNGYYNIYGQMVSSNGSLIGSEFVISKIYSTVIALLGLDVVWSGTNYLVTWVVPNGSSYQIYGEALL
jgi:hypothetical protein